MSLLAGVRKPCNEGSTPLGEPFLHVAARVAGERYCSRNIPKGEPFDFSETGLRDQLVFDGFTQAQASYGVANSQGDWFAEAAESAQGYVEIEPSITRAELIDQLMYEGFTQDQAAYGADSVNL